MNIPDEGLLLAITGKVHTIHHEDVTIAAATFLDNGGMKRLMFEWFNARIVADQFCVYSRTGDPECIVVGDGVTLPYMREPPATRTVLGWVL